MKKNRLIALLLAVLFVVAFAFSGIMAESEPAAITAGRHSVSLESAQAAFDALAAEYEAYYASYGLSLTAEEYAQIRDIALENLALYCVLDNVAEDMGIGVVTEEVEAELREQAQATYDEAYQYVIDYYTTYYGLSEEEAQKQADSEVEAAGYTVDTIYEQLKESYPYYELYDAVTKDVALSDEEIETYYQENYVQPDEETYANDIYNYELSRDYYGTQIYFVPEGYRNVSHILLTTPEDIAAELEACEEEIAAAQEQVDLFAQELGALEVQPEEGTEAAEQDDRRSAEEIQVDLDAANAALDALNEEYAQIEEKVIPALQEKIDEIYAKLEAGESFESLIEAYGEDPGMAQNAEGYQVHAESFVWDPDFRDGAMALKAVGDVSDPVQSSFGVHIIKYLSDVPSGPVALEGDLYDSVSNAALVAARDSVFLEKEAEWMQQYPPQIVTEGIVLPEVAAVETAEETAEEAVEEPAEETVEEESAEEAAVEEPAEAETAKEAPAESQQDDTETAENE